ncbi:tetratricopeptide repeat protein [Thermococcus sp. 9N3]|uniref:tetratricopeptide repeat protein n=1 Tax=Thermococcus sp. 9N3 TaxID=163002 RepID=UPI00197F390B|nr:tetratricopeptide repeat protein [Thermococcus sp. 9N3]
MVSVESVKERLNAGDFKGALERARSLDDPLQRILALSLVMTEFPREEVLSEMLEAVERVTGTYERAIAYSLVGRAFYILDREKGGFFYFERAVSLAKSLPSPRLRGEALAGIARNLVLADRYGDAYILFSEAVDEIQRARGLSSRALETLRRVARLIEKSADEIPNEKALAFYRLARDIYDSLFFKLQAKHLSDKIALIEDVLKHGRAVVTELIEKGDVERAIEVMRFLPLEDRAVEMLHLSYWLFLHERPYLARKVFNDALDLILVGKFQPRDGEILSIARKMLKIGRLEEPLILAGVIRDGGLSSELLGEVALAYSRKDPARARSIAEGIRDESVKRRVLNALEGGEDVGHEQGLPLTGGGEGDRALPEDG